MKKQEHIIEQVKKKSIAWKLGIMPQDRLIEINQNPITDIFDYEYLAQDTELDLTILRKNEELHFHIEKEEDEEIGLVFENGLMDDYRSCHNKCIFCFIDQMPKGMRETLYFKDDDSRLSFLQGNYITLTNMSQDDVDRICKYHLAPINISFQTTNPELRCKMLNNRFAGDALKKVDDFMKADIEMNGQIVLCKGVNDGEELNRTLHDLMKYIPNLQSVSVVPVGLSKFREGLYPLEPFSPEDSREVLKQIHAVQKECMEQYQTHFVHASDEWYIQAGQELPPEEQYDDYPQLSNGVGMVRILLNEFDDAMEHAKTDHKIQKLCKKAKGTISIATGKLAYPYMKQMAERVEELMPDRKVHVYCITNHFFGENITVSGLITGQDLIAQLSQKIIGDKLLLPENMLRSGETVFLDDITVAELEKTLHVKTDIVKSSGQDFLEALIRKV